MTKNANTDKLAALRAKVKGQPTKKSAKAKTPKKTEVAVTTAPTPLKKEEIAYVISDKMFGEFAVKKSANAWWMDAGKVELLIDGFKRRFSIRQASIRAVLSDDQVHYFISKHPEFSGIIERCRERYAIKAKDGLGQLLDNNDGPTIRWFLETTEPAEYGKKPPLVAVQINMHERVADDRGAYT